MTALPQTSPWPRIRAGAETAASPAALWPAGALIPLFALLAWRSWSTWPDPLIDFGRELYVPWRMTEGDVLYRDLAYFNGPLSPTLNAIWFALFGASLRTLVVANLAILAATTALLHGLLRQLSTRTAATTACAAFVALCGFSQFTHTRNYNFICPYSHEMTHGLLLSLLAVAVAWQVTRRGAIAVAIAGLLLGLVLLTKVELAIAATAVVAVSVIWLSSEERYATIAFRVLLLAAMAALAPLAAIATLAQWMPWSDAYAGCFGAWHMAGAAEIRNLNFYRSGLGTLHLGDSLAMLATSAARWALLLGTAYILTRLMSTAPPHRRRATAAVFGGALAAGLFDYGFNWPLMERAFPLTMLALAAWKSIESWRAAPGSNARRTAALSALWCLFALVLLAKIALYSRIGHYGFVLAAPALVAIVVAIFDWLPAAARRRGLPADVLPWFAAPVLLAYVLAYQCQQSVLVDRTTPLGVGADHFAAAADARPVARAAQEILRRVAADQTLAVLPEGVMLNYLTRRPAPTKFITWMPPELYFFGEANMLAALTATPPDWVLLAPRGLKEYGVPPFGAGYADSLARWIDANYEQTAQWSGSTVGAADAQQPWRLLRHRRGPLQRPGRQPPTADHLTPPPDAASQTPHSPPAYQSPG